jgi:hypothetical protein
MLWMNRSTHLKALPRLPPADYDASAFGSNPDAALVVKGDARGDAHTIPNEGDEGGGSGGDGGAIPEGGFEGGEAGPTEGGLADAVADATDATTEASRETGVADGPVRDGPEAGGDH